MSEISLTRQLEAWLKRLHAGDETARDALINLACDRLTQLTRKMIRDYPRLHQWEQTDDVAQNAAMRLRKALEDVTPDSPRGFFRLAASHIRRELIDLSRAYYGRKPTHRLEENPSSGQAACGPKGEADGQQPPKAATPARSPAHARVIGKDDTKNSPIGGPEGIDETNDPAQLAAWREFHTQVEELPDKEKEVVELLWYQGMTQEEAAELLSVDKSTIKHRWRSARMRLHQSLQGWLPGV